MTPPEKARQRLADLMEERRLELRLDWADVARHGAVSVKALYDARNGTSRPRRSTMRGIDAGLRWAPGSAERILGDDGDPLPVSGTGATAGDLIRRARTEHHMSAEHAVGLMTENGPPEAAVTAAQWQQMEAGAPVAATLLAHAAKTVGVSGEQLASAGHGEVADLLRQITSGPAGNDELAERRELRQTLVSLRRQLDDALARLDARDEQGRAR